MNPLALGSAGALVAVLAGVVVVLALYLLRPPLRRFLVPSSLIWERVLRQSHAGRDRLRWWLSLLLATLIVAAVIVAIVRPQVLPTGAGGERLVLVLDNSPTMATRTTDGASRWDHAVERARTLIEARGAGARVWLADSMRRIATPAFEDRDAALERLAQLTVVHGGTPRVPLPPPDMESGEAEVVVITDGVRITEVPRSARLESVFDPVENTGITAFELRPLPADPRRVQAFVEVANGGGTPKEVALAVTGLGGSSAGRTFTVAAGAAHVELLDVSEFESGPVRASLTVPGDGLAADDTAYAWLPLRRVVRVNLVTEGNPWLEKALRAQPRVLLTVMPPSRYADRRDAEAWVFDRYTPRTPPVAPALLFHPARADWLPAPAGELVNPAVGTWDSEHPLLANISLNDLYIERAQRTSARKDAADAVLIAAANDAPLAWTQDQGTRRVALEFALDRSNFALHAAFPVFLNNALNWMTAEPTLLKSSLGVLEIPLADAHVIGADGTELPVRAIPGGGLVEMSEPGFYTAVTDKQRLRIAVNVLDRRTTEVNRSPLQSMPTGTDAATPRAAARVDPWLALLLGAIVLLCLEWLGWNRRVTL
jgi:Ca-activated chloride channel homolog